MTLIKSNDGLQHSDFEKLRSEFIDAFKEYRAAEFLSRLKDQGNLHKFNQELAECVGVDGGLHHNETIFAHLVRALQKAESQRESPILRLAALLHDIAKPKVAAMVSLPDGRKNTTFIGHEQAGEPIACDFCQRMGFDREASEVAFLVREHMWSFPRQARDRTLYRWLFKMGRDGYRNLLILRRIDREANFAWSGEHANLEMFEQRLAALIERRLFVFRCQISLYQCDNTLRTWRERLDRASSRLGFFSGDNLRFNIEHELINILNQDPSKNNNEWIFDYAKRVHNVC